MSVGQGDSRSERHGAEMNQRRRERDRDEDGHGWKAGRERERHQLALVAELGDEDHAEGQEEGIHLDQPQPRARAIRTTSATTRVASSS
jgi:hypothetical protein